MKRFFNNVIAIVRDHIWTTDNYWLRISIIRKAVLRIIFYFSGILERAEFARKIKSINVFIESFLSDPDPGRYFTTPAHDEAAGLPTQDHGKGHNTAYLKPGAFFRDRLRDFLLGINIREEERSFRLDDCIAHEKELLADKKRTGHSHRVFTKEGRAEFRSFFGADASSAVLPESYIKHFFSSFDPAEFVRNGAHFIIGDRKLFGPRETIAVIDFFMMRVRMRNPRSYFQRIVPVFKKAVCGLFLAYWLALFMFDLAVMIYGTAMNEYYYSFSNFGQSIETCETPYAHRANRIFRRNHGARFADYKSSGETPPGNAYRINNSAQTAIELNYRSYRSLRAQDQNGLTVIAIDHKKIRELVKSDPRQYRRLVELAVSLSWWESLMSFIDDASGHEPGFFDYNDIPYDRLCAGIADKIMNSAAPLAWIDRVNGISDVITVLYYKAHSMKWTDLGEVPEVMLEAVILREDRRFRNVLFPVPHRGNDNLVIIPQIATKLFRIMLDETHGFAGRNGFAWLERQCADYKKNLNDGIFEENRGGSSISNQVMEMLYTKYIPTLSKRESFKERQIEQKEHELPASLAVGWVWSRNNILEAYVNEVYGGHLYSDIRGFKSQAEMYFMRDLRDLNLREQIMLVAAIKKPSRIKEYAMWLKADELRSLIGTPGTTRESLAKWEMENPVYKVDRNNYADVLNTKLKAKVWIEARMYNILTLLRNSGTIGDAEYGDARRRQKVEFRFASGIYSADNRLVNNIKRELDRELGSDRSDSGLVAVTTIDMDMQKKLQALINRSTRWISVDPDFVVEGQPEQVLLEGGARIVRAHDGARSGPPKIVNRIIADVGGTSRAEDEWDWISLANRSLGSSLKPFLDLYFILSGYNLQDMFKNSRVTYKTYTLEQQRIFRNFMHKYPKRIKEIEGIEKYWSWSPRNFMKYNNDWISVEDAIVHSVNGVHVQIQELVTPAVFARLLNEMMDITEPEGKHRPFRSIILGGSSGDQRYDRYLLAYSLFPNLGVLKKHTYIDTLLRPDGAVMRPDYRPLKSDLLERFGAERIRAACMLIDLTLRETVKRGTMAGMEGIGAGKTGTSNELRDAMATVHFIAGGSAYIAGVRLGNRHNYSIGRAADRLAVPLLRNLVTGVFDGADIMKGDDYDAYLMKQAGACREIERVNDRFFLKGRACAPRRLEVSKAQEERQKECLAIADKYFDEDRYNEAARYYEEFLRLAAEFNSGHPAFGKMIRCYIRTGNLKRAGQIIERFALPGRIWNIARAYEKKYGVNIKVDDDFYSGDEEYERRKHEKAARRKKKRNVDAP